MKKILFFIAAIALTALAVNANAAQDVRGQVTDVSVSEFTWDNSNFAGFYYDADNNLGAESITFILSNSSPYSAILSDQTNADDHRGATYETRAQTKSFKYLPWGQYKVIGLLGDRYFAAYSSGYLYDVSKDRNLMTNEQLTRLLIDDNKEITVTSNASLKLDEGYQLAIKQIDTDGNKAYLELSKNGQVVDSKVVQPSIANATIDDQTYYYKTQVGTTSDIIQIAVHFKNAFISDNSDIATVDGIFQISDAPISLNNGQQFDKMSIRNVDSTGMFIVMDNKDNQITLSKNKDVSLMQNIYIKTSDQDTINDVAPLRYYIYQKL